MISDKTEKIIDPSLRDLDNIDDEISHTDTVTSPLPLDDSPKEPSPKRRSAAAPLTPEVQAHLDEDLLARANEIREQRIMLRNRLEKIEASKGQVKDSVYEKVQADYSDRLDQSRSALLNIKGDIDRSLAELRSQEAEVTRQVLEHEDTIEEADFRKELGEYSKKDFKELTSKAEAALKQARSEQMALQNAILQYEEIFEGENIQELMASQTPPPAPGADKVPPPPNVGAVEPRAAGRHGTETQAAAPKEPLVVLYENGQELQRYPLEDEITIGRSPNNLIVLKEAKVSRRHAVIRRSGSEFMIVDNNSSNGTYVNDKPVTDQVLNSGDKIKIGSYEMVFTV